jgi:hypothetical protein
MQNECKNPPLCYFCHDSGHMSTRCPHAEAQKQGLTMYGFGVPKMGFYHIHVPEKGVQKGEEENSGVMVIKEGVANTGLVKMELKVYDEDWDWQVKQCDRDTFRIVFPCKMVQQYFTRLKSFEFNSATVKARITTSDLPQGHLLG